MDALLAAPERLLCRVEDIADGGSKGFPAAPGGFVGLFAVRRGADVFVYVNSCPHIGVPLDIAPDRFLSADSTHIVCAAHGACFTIEDGVCFSGPCRGDALESVPVRVQDGVVYVAADAGL